MRQWPLHTMHVYRAAGTAPAPWARRTRRLAIWLAWPGRVGLGLYRITGALDYLEYMASDQTVG